VQGKGGVTVGFRVPDYFLEIVDTLCDNEDLNRSQIFRRALQAYEPLRVIIDDFEKSCPDELININEEG
jgi:Ribbon-helix-helix protein, copG family